MCGYGITVLRHLAMVETRVRLPLPAPSTLFYSGPLARRGGQAVRQGSAKPSPRVRFPSTPPMLYLQIVHTFIAVLLIVSVLLQQRGSGLGDAFGADSAVYTSRRGVEKLLFYLTIVFGTAFVLMAVLQLVINK